MTINLTELRDEPLGTPKSARMARGSLTMCFMPCLCTSARETEIAQGAAADGEGVFKIDVDGLSDEALGPVPGPLSMCTPACGCVLCYGPTAHALETQEHGA